MNCDGSCDYDLTIPKIGCVCVCVCVCARARAGACVCFIFLLERAKS